MNLILIDERGEMQELSKREANKKKKREDLLKAAEQLILDTGTTDFSMVKLAKLAKVGEVTPYKYFETKMGLLVELHQDRTADVFDGLDDFDEIRADGLALTLQFSSRATDSYCAREGLFRPLIAGIFKLAPEQISHESISHDWIQGWSKRLKIAETANQLSDFASIDLLARALHMMSIGTMIKWAFYETDNEQVVADMNYGVLCILASASSSDERDRLQRELIKAQKKSLKLLRRS